MYEAKHQLDELGGRYGVAVVDYRGPDLSIAVGVAEERTASGQAGFVVRVADGATLMPSGEWVSEEAEK